MARIDTRANRPAIGAGIGVGIGIGIGSRIGRVMAAGMAGKSGLGFGAGCGVLLLLAACGGRPDDGPAQAGQQANDLSPPSSARAMSVSTDFAAARPVGARAASAVAADGDLDQMKQQIALLRREVADIRQQLSGLPGASRASEVVPNPRTDPDARVEAARTEQLRIASTESTFRNEEPDARWSQGTTASVRAALSDVDESVRGDVRSIECRSQSCRVEIGSDASGALARDLPLIVARLGQALPNVTAGQIDQGDGRQATVLYLSR